MTGTTFFQIFLVFDVFMIGFLASAAVRHAYAHYKPAKEEPEPTPLPVIPNPLPPNFEKELLEATEDRFQTVINHSAYLLKHDLESTAGQVNGLVQRLATEIVNGELERYHEELAKLHTQAQADMSGIRKDIDAHQAEIKAKMEQEVQAEKLRLVKQIDTKLADAVGSFLVETLQHNVDLGAQGDYLIATLEEHKADFVKEIADDAQLAK